MMSYGSETTTTTAPVRYCRGSSAPCRCATCRLAEQRALDAAQASTGGNPGGGAAASSGDCQHSLRVVRSGMELCDEGCGAVLGDDPLADFPQSGAENTPAREESATRFAGIGLEIGELVETKQRAYGDSYGRSGEVMRVLYPDGIRPDQYDDALAVVRVVDKLFRIATDRDALGESPWRDVAGYGILGAARVERADPA